MTRITASGVICTMRRIFPRPVTPHRTPAARGPIIVAAIATFAVLLAVSGRYGYHRDELYFLQAGRHPAFGYPDQPPLVPLLARLLSAVAPGSVSVLRVPSAVVGALIVGLTGAIAREVGGGRSAQTLAAASAAVSAVVLASCHLLSTSTVNLLAWTLLSWLVVRLLLGGAERGWLLVGLVAGIGLLAHPLVALLAFGVFIGVLIAGPRPLLRSPWLWAGAALALAMWSPYLAWQAAHDWPQIDMSRAIASGSSGTSAPRALFLPYQVVLVSPVLVPVWIAGLVRLFRDPSLRPLRCLGWAYVVLAVAFIVTGGKPYYITGLYLLLLAVGAAPTVAWASRGKRRLRKGLLVAAVALSAVIGGVVTLPIVPLDVLHSTPIVALSYDQGEQIGWPRLVDTVDRVYRAVPTADRPSTVIFTENYGEAGAVDRYGPRLGLPEAFSGHNGFANWGPPPETGGPVVVVGYSRALLQRYWATVSAAATIRNGHHVDNDEDGTTVWVCRQQRQPWRLLWPQLRHLG